MATPHVAGMMAVLRQLNPDASSDELKALAMNSAAHDVTLGANNSGERYGGSSVGAGRVDVAHAAGQRSARTNNDANGSTSVTFDVEPVGSQSFLHDVRIVNGFERRTAGRAVDRYDRGRAGRRVFGGRGDSENPASGPDRDQHRHGDRRRSR
jgi:hypothetical protein